MKKLAFSNLIKTDGFSADVVLLKSLAKNKDDYERISDQDVDISLFGDAMRNENLDDVSLCGLDPNRNQVFAAAYGHGEEPHQIRRFSTKEYYTHTGSIRHAKKEKQRMAREQMETIFLQMPSAKTVSLSKYLTYVSYLLRNLGGILQYNRHSTAESRFHLFQGTQRARQEMANILINGGKKYNKAKRKNTKKNRKMRKKRKKKRDKVGSKTEKNAPQKMS